MLQVKSTISLQFTACVSYLRTFFSQQRDPMNELLFDTNYYLTSRHSVDTWNAIVDSCERHKDILALAVTLVSDAFINPPLAHIFTLIFQRCLANSPSSLSLAKLFSRNIAGLIRDCIRLRPQPGR